MAIRKHSPAFETPAPPGPADAGPRVVDDKDPPDGTAVAQNGSIRVVVSQGSGIVPDVRGTWPQSATWKLQDAGLMVGTTSYVHDDRVPPGQGSSPPSVP